MVNILVEFHEFIATTISEIKSIKDNRLQKHNIYSPLLLF